MSDEPGLAFVDTNIFIYAYDRTAGPKHERARDLVASLGRDRRGGLSTQVLQEFFVNATKKIPNPLSADDARRRVEALARWRTHAPAPGDVLEAIDIHERHGVSFWDAMIVRSAVALGCEVLLTEDLNPGQAVAGVRVENPLS